MDPLIGMLPNMAIAAIARCQCMIVTPAGDGWRSFDTAPLPSDSPCASLPQASGT